MMKKGILILVAMITLSTGVFAQKYGHVEAQTLLIELPEYKEAGDSIVKFSQQLEADMQVYFDAYQAFVKQFELDLASGSLPPELEKPRRQEMTDKQVRLQQKQQEAQALIQQREADLIEPLFKMIRDAIAKVARDNKYNYIFDVSALMYADGGDDVSNLVRKELGIPIPTKTETVGDGGTGTGGGQ